MSNDDYCTHSFQHTLEFSQRYQSNIPSLNCYEFNAIQHLHRNNAIYFTLSSLLRNRAPPCLSSIQLYKDTDLICSPIKRGKKKKESNRILAILRGELVLFEFLNHSRFPPRCRETWRKLWDLRNKCAQQKVKIS